MSDTDGRVWDDLRQPFEFSIDRHTFALVPEALSRADPHTTDPVEFLAPQFSTSGSVSLGDVNRSVEIPQAQDNFSGGISPKIQFDTDTATRFRYSKGVDTSGPPGTLYPQPKITTLGAVIASQPLKCIERGDITYLAAGAVLYQITDLSTMTLDTTFADTITDLILYADAIFVAFGEAHGNMQYRVSDVSGGAFTDSGVKADRLAVVQNNPIGPVFYRTYTTTAQIHASTTPKVGPWVTFTIGDNSNGSGITSVTAHGDHVIVGKNDGPWEFDINYVARPILDASIKLENYVTMVRQTISWNGVFVFSGKHSLYAWDGKSLTSIGLDLYPDAAVPSASYTIDGLCADPHFLYATIAEQHASSPVGGVYIWKTRDGRTWHNFVYRSELGQGSGMLFATNKLGSVSQNAILFAYKVSTNWQVAWAPWPATLDPGNDSSYTFDNTVECRLRTCDFTAGVPTMPKRTDRLKMVADHLSTTAFVDVYAYIDDEAAVRVQTFERSPDQELAFLRGQDWRRMSLEIRFTGAGTTKAAAQIIHGIEFPARVLSRIVQRHRVYLMAMDALPLATGGRTSPRGGYARVGNWKAIRDDLYALRKENAQVDVQDEEGRTFTAYLGGISTRTIVHPDGGHGIKTFVVTLDEVQELP